MGLKVTVQVLWLTFRRGKRKHNSQRYIELNLTLNRKPQTLILKPSKWCDHASKYWGIRLGSLGVDSGVDGRAWVWGVGL